VIAPHGGFIKKGPRSSEIVERTFLTTRSIEFDAVVVAGGTGELYDHRVVTLLQEAYRHCKVIGTWGDGVEVLRAAMIDTSAPGVLVHDSASAAARKELINAMGLHRAWARIPVPTPA
jgi:catalase